MRCRRLSRTRVVAHVLVRRPSSAARREHPIHTFVVPFPRSRGEREPLRILHRTIVVRLSSRPATVIRTTSGIPPEDGMNPRDSTRSPDIKGPASKDSPCSRRPRFSQAAGTTVPADLVFIRSSSKVFSVGQGHSLNNSTRRGPFISSPYLDTGGPGHRRTLEPPGNGKLHATWAAGLLVFAFSDPTGR